MFEMMRPLTRGIGALGVLIGVSVVPMAAHAATPVDATAAPTEALSDGDAQIVARDLATGKLRAATPEEAQALRSHRAALRGGKLGTQPRSHWSGAVGARLTEEFMTYSVVVKQADGRLVEICVEGSDAATKAVDAAPVSKSAELPTE